MLQYRTTEGFQTSPTARPHKNTNNDLTKARKPRGRNSDEYQGQATENTGHGQHRPTGPDRRYVLTFAELAEVLDLLTDAPGEVDENLLLDALESLYMPLDVTGQVLEDVQAGRFTAFKLDANERMALRSLITEFGSSAGVRMHQRLISILTSAQSHAEQRVQKK